MKQLSFKFVAEYENDELKKHIIKSINMNNEDISNPNEDPDYVSYCKERNNYLNNILSTL
jgi:hypothetical protein